MPGEHAANIAALERIPSVEDGVRLLEALHFRLLPGKFQEFTEGVLESFARRNRGNKIGKRVRGLVSASLWSFSVKFCARGDDDSPGLVVIKAVLNVIRNVKFSFKTTSEAPFPPLFVLVSRAQAILTNRSFDNVYGDQLPLDSLTSAWGPKQFSKTVFGTDLRDFNSSISPDILVTGIKTILRFLLRVEKWNASISKIIKSITMQSENVNIEKSKNASQDYNYYDDESNTEAYFFTVPKAMDKEKGFASEDFDQEDTKGHITNKKRDTAKKAGAKGPATDKSHSLFVQFNINTCRDRVTKAAFMRAFGKFGKITKIYIPVNHNHPNTASQHKRESSRKFPLYKGYAFVQYEDSNSLDPAVKQLHQKEINGVWVKVRRADSQPAHATNAESNRKGSVNISGSKRSRREQNPCARFNSLNTGLNANSNEKYGNKFVSPMCMPPPLAYYATRILTSDIIHLLAEKKVTIHLRHKLVKLTEDIKRNLPEIPWKNFSNQMILEISAELLPKHLELDGEHSEISEKDAYKALQDDEITARKLGEIRKSNPYGMAAAVFKFFLEVFGEGMDLPASVNMWKSAHRTWMSITVAFLDSVTESKTQNVSGSLRKILEYAYKAFDFPCSQSAERRWKLKLFKIVTQKHIQLWEGSSRLGNKHELTRKGSSRERQPQKKRRRTLYSFNSYVIAN